MIFMDIVMLFNGYHTCVYRCFCCGKPNQRQKDIHKILLHKTHIFVQKFVLRIIRFSELMFEHLPFQIPVML